MHRCQRIHLRLQKRSSPSHSHLQHIIENKENLFTRTERLKKLPPSQLFFEPVHFVPSHVKVHVVCLPLHPNIALLPSRSIHPSFGVSGSPHPMATNECEDMF